jgi:hypothetical protein
MAGDEFLEGGAKLRQAELNLEREIARAKEKGLSAATIYVVDLIRRHDLAAKQLAALTGEFLRGS